MARWDAPCLIGSEREDVGALEPCGGLDLAKAPLAKAPLAKAWLGIYHCSRLRLQNLEQSRHAAR